MQTVFKYFQKKFQLIIINKAIDQVNAGRTYACSDSSHIITYHSRKAYDDTSDYLSQSIDHAYEAYQKKKKTIFRYSPIALLQITE